MWIYFNNAALSIVAHRTNPNVLLVRSRKRGDIEAIFPRAKVSETPRRDYQFRAEIGRATVANKIAEIARTIQYDNFKGSVSDRERHDVYFDVYDATLRLGKPHARKGFDLPDDPYSETAQFRITGSRGRDA